MNQVKQMSLQEAMDFYSEQISTLRTNNAAMKTVIIMLINMMGRDGIIDSASIKRDIRNIALGIAANPQSPDELCAIMTEVCSIVENTDTGPKADLIEFPG